MRDLQIGEIHPSEMVWFSSLILELIRRLDRDVGGWLDEYLG